MTFRSRLAIALLMVAIVPLAALGLAIRQRVSSLLESQFQQRVTTLVDVIRQDLDRQDRMVASRLEAIGAGMQADNRLRRGLLQPGMNQSYVLDYAQRVMSQSGLAILQIQDAAGRIASSGHFRNEYELVDPALPNLLTQVPGGRAIARVRTAEEPLLGLVRMDSVMIGAQSFTLVGGVRVDTVSLFALQVTDELSVTLRLPEDGGRPGESAADSLIVSEFPLPFVETRIGGDPNVGVARIVVGHSLAPLDDVRRSLSAWLALAIGLSALAAALLAVHLSRRISRPLAELAERASEVDLDRLDVSFAGERRDEIGALARVLGSMTERLRTSVRTLKEVEREAALGDLARQVNHDVKNGLIPIRNVFRHLGEVARDDPTRLPEVYRERQRTVETAVEYLEKLAATYAGLSPRLDLVPCDVNALVGRVIRVISPLSNVTVQPELAATAPMARADVLALRRVVENLVSNALDSLAPDGGTVVVTTSHEADKNGLPMVQLSVADTGKGMTADELDRAFGDFYTTKPRGTGLGLSIVRRLVRDLGGTLRVVTEPGSGTQIFVELPRAEERA
jgi:signal transduction histidine kinase